MLRALCTACVAVAIPAAALAQSPSPHERSFRYPVPPQQVATPAAQRPPQHQRPHHRPPYAGSTRYAPSVVIDGSAYVTPSPVRASARPSTTSTSHVAGQDTFRSYASGH